MESLQTVVVKYLKVLKSPEHAGMIDTRTVDEIFFMVPDILEIHEKFLVELKRRLDDWDVQQKVGDAFIETVSSTLTSLFIQCESNFIVIIPCSFPNLKYLKFTRHLLTIATGPKMQFAR